jgi:hypothetical protein
VLIQPPAEGDTSGSSSGGRKADLSIQPSTMVKNGGAITLVLHKYTVCVNYLLPLSDTVWMTRSWA